MKLKNPKYNNGAIGKASRSSLFLASPIMLMSLGCYKVGTEICECGVLLEIFHTSFNRYMPLTRVSGDLYNRKDEIIYQLHWHE